MHYLCFNPRSRDSVSFYNAKIMNYFPMNSTISNLVDTEIVEFICIFQLKSVNHCLLITCWVTDKKSKYQNKATKTLNLPVSNNPNVHLPKSKEYWVNLHSSVVYKDTELYLLFFIQ